MSLSVASVIAGSPCCPLCGADRQRRLAEHNGRLLVKCQQCNVRYLFPQPDAQEVSLHFQEQDALDEEHLKRKFEVNRERVLSRVAQHIQHTRSGGAILDVGCATGLFLHRFFPRGEWESWGVDLSPNAVRSASEKGIQVHRGTVRSAQFAPNTFDVVTVLDAFYYFPQPEVELAEFRRILKNDGMVVLELPLATARIWRRSAVMARVDRGARPLLQSSDHLFYFTPKSISTLMSKCGFRVTAVVPLPGNRQSGTFRELAMQSYSYTMLLLARLSFSRLFLTPRFLVAAVK